MTSHSPKVQALVEHLVKLANLREQGLLSPQEYDAFKSTLLTSLSASDGSLTIGRDEVLSDKVRARSRWIANCGLGLVAAIVLGGGLYLQVPSNPPASCSSDETIGLVRGIVADQLFKVAKFSRLQRIEPISLRDVATDKSDSGVLECAATLNIDSLAVKKMASDSSISLNTTDKEWLSAFAAIAMIYSLHPSGIRIKYSVQKLDGKIFVTLLSKKLIPG